MKKLIEAIIEKKEDLFLSSQDKNNIIVGTRNHGDANIEITREEIVFRVRRSFGYLSLSNPPSTLFENYTDEFQLLAREFDNLRMFIESSEYKQRREQVRPELIENVKHLMSQECPEYLKMPIE